MSTLTLTPTSNSITAEVNSFYEEDRILEWYLNGTLKATTSSGLIVNYYTFTPVPFWSPYHVEVKIYTSDHTGLLETVSGDTDTTFASLSAWNWNASNGSATADQTREAYTSATTKEQTRKFNHAVWNDIIAYILEARQASGQPPIVNTDMTIQADDPLTAIIMNAAVKNVDYPWWTWRDDPDDYDVDGRYISYLGRLAFQRGDVVFGRYIIELVKRLNTMRNIYSGRNISSSAVGKQIVLAHDAYLHVPQTEDIFATKNIILTQNAALRNDTGKLLNVNYNLPLLYTAALNTITHQLPLDTQRQIVVNTIARMSGGIAAHFNATTSFELETLALAVSSLGANMRATRNITLGNSATARISETKQLEAAKAILLANSATARISEGKLVNAANAVSILLSAALEIEELDSFFATWTGTLSYEPHLILTESVLARAYHEIELAYTPNLITSNSAPLRINSAAVLNAIANFARLGIIEFPVNHPIYLTPITDITAAQTKQFEAGESNTLTHNATAAVLQQVKFQGTNATNLSSNAVVNLTAQKLLRDSTQAILQSVAALSADSTHGYDLNAIRNILLNYSAALLLTQLVSPITASQSNTLISIAEVSIGDTKTVLANQSANLESETNAAIVPPIYDFKANVNLTTQTNATVNRLTSKPMKCDNPVTLNISATAHNPIATVLPLDTIEVSLNILRTLNAQIAAPLFPPIIAVNVDILRTLNASIAAPLFLSPIEISLNIGRILTKAQSEALQLDPIEMYLAISADTSIGEAKQLQSDSIQAHISNYALMERAQRMTFSTIDGAILNYSAKISTTGQKSVDAGLEMECILEAEIGTANIINISAALGTTLSVAAEAEADSGGWIYPVQTGNSLYIRQAYHIDDNDGSLYLGYKMPIQTGNSLYIRQLYYFYQDGNTIYTSWINPEQDGNSLYIRQSWENITDDQEDGE